MKDIVVSHLQKSFDGRTVLSDLNLNFPAGSLTCIMGPSGCGKTTLLNILAGLLQPDGGSVSGVPERLSMVFQEDRLCEDFSALKNVQLVTGNRLDEDAILSQLSQLGLADSARLPAKNLSGGMKRRVAIARAVCYDADLLLLDEAFKGLDDQRRRLTMDYIKAHSKNKTVICITHDPAEAEYLGGRLIQLEAINHENRDKAADS